MLPEMDPQGLAALTVVSLPPAHARRRAPNEHGVDLFAIRDAYLGDPATADAAMLDMDEPIGRLTPERLAAKLAALNFQDRILQQGHFEQPDPLDGRLLRSGHSIPTAASTFYRFVGREVFFVVCSSFANGFARVLLWLPQRRLAIALSSGFAQPARARATLAPFVQLISDNLQAYTDYLQAAPSGEIALLLRTPPFPHHVWNELPGLERMLQAGLLTRVRRIYVGAQPVAELAQLYPELASRIEVVKARRAPRLIFRHRELLVRPGSLVISEAVVERLQQLAERQASEQVRALRQSLRDSGLPVLGLTLRTHNRRWRGEQAGLIALLNTLAAEGLRFRVLLLGFSLPAELPQYSNYEQQIAQERERCANIIAQCPQLQVDALVGEPLLDCIALAPMLDFYVANHGTIQHKIGWFARCGGLIHANRYTLDRQIGFFATLGARQAGIAPQFLQPDTVRDVESTSTAGDGRGRSNLQDYDFDWRELLEPVRAALQSTR